MHRGGRLYWRRVRQLERCAPRVRHEYRAELDYDRNDIMAKIDSLPMGWRILINEFGFTPVMQARQYSTDIRVVEKMMAQRWQKRQQQLANARY